MIGGEEQRGKEGRGKEREGRGRERRGRGGGAYRGHIAAHDRIGQ